jgi:hypothetical protein
MMNSLWSSSRSGSDVPPPADISKADDVADVGPDPSAVLRRGAAQNNSLNRPLLLRNNPPPPPPPEDPRASTPYSQHLPQQAMTSRPDGGPQTQLQLQQQQMTVQQATDSLSLMQLRKMVAEIRQQPDPVAYDFEYADMGPHGEEIDEWFSYLLWQRVRLNSMQRLFDWQWREQYGGDDEDGVAWADASEDLRAEFLRDALKQIEVGQPAERAPGVTKLTYLVLGRWGDTAVPVPEDGRRCVASDSQLEAIDDGVRMLAGAGGIEVIWKALRQKFDLFWYDSSEALQLSRTLGATRVLD